MRKMPNFAQTLSLYAEFRSLLRSTLVVMKARSFAPMDGNEAAAHVAYRTNEVIGIYPITPASPMGEWADQWSARGIPNIWGDVPKVFEMQSEGGAVGALHGALQAGALATTFTASQGLLLMLPNFYKIAGELTSAVFHVAARSLATQALSIFGDHSDVMAARSTGWGMLFSSSVQESMDMALIAQAATLQARVPILHIFDGFRTSHEIQKIEVLDDEDIRSMIDDGRIAEHRARALSPEHPFIRGTAQNPDTYFQAREASNPYYLALPSIVQDCMNRFGELTGRRYRLFEYHGAEDAEEIIIISGSGASTAQETVDYLNSMGRKVGVLSVRLFRPFDAVSLIDAIPATVKRISVLDRTKEPGSIGEPLYLDVLAGLQEPEGLVKFGQMPIVRGGRYGLSSKEFTPGMIVGVFDDLASSTPKNHFTIGIHDDITQTSLPWNDDLDIEPDSVVRAMFWGLGSDGTVGANKNTIKIIADRTDFHTQAYFVYDSRKAGARTISHLRFGPDPIRGAYLIKKANFIGVHQFSFLNSYDTLEAAAEGATVLLNCPHPPERVWEHLPSKVRRQIVDRNLKLFVVDAYHIAREAKLSVRINTIMQMAFFALSNILPPNDARQYIREAIEKTYGKRGEAVVQMNFKGVDLALEYLFEVPVPDSPDLTEREDEDAYARFREAPEFIRDVTAPLLAGEGDRLPVSSFPVDGTYPSATTRWEKRNLARDIPVWEPDVCIQCGLCVLVCPHAVIRGKVYEPSKLESAPENWKSAGARWRNLPDKQFTLQVAPEDCTGCSLCVEVCPAKDKSNVGRKAINMSPQLPLLEQERENWDFFVDLPEMPKVASNGNGEAPLKFKNAQDIQLLQPLFEFSGACAGCGETPYLKLMSQLFGDRTFVANATGCSSIYGGNLPTTPWAVNGEGKGPAWSNSLFEDNAEFGLGIRVSIDKQTTTAQELVEKLRTIIGDELTDALLSADQLSEGGIAEQRARVESLKGLLQQNPDNADAGRLLNLCDTLVRKSVWLVGGDGWAYDIGYGGLDHVIANPYDVNILVLDTEVYSNTGGQASKSTPLGAVAKFAAGGKPTAKKNLALLAMDYGHVYVAQVAMGASPQQTIKAFQEAESYPGPSLIIAYSHCIAHGIDMTKGLDQQKLASQTGHWPLFRYDPRRHEEERNPFQLDSKAPSRPLEEYLYNEGRYRMLRQSQPETAKHLLGLAKGQVEERWKHYLELASMS